MTSIAVSRWIADLGIWPLIVVLFPYVIVLRRRGPESQKKKVATVIHAVGLFVLLVAAATIIEFGLSDLLLVPVVAALAAAGYRYRDRAFPYRLSCPECGARHAILSEGFTNFYAMDDNLCDDCRGKRE